MDRTRAPACRGRSALNATADGPAGAHSPLVRPHHRSQAASKLEYQRADKSARGQTLLAEAAQMLDSEIEHEREQHDIDAEGSDTQN